MEAVNVHQAKTHLSRLLVEVEKGGEVVIARHGVPVARLVPFKPAGKRRYGAFKGQFKVPASFFDPLPETELAAWED